MKFESITDSRVFLSMPNPWIIHEFVVSGSVTKKLVIDSITAALKDNGLLGLQIIMESQTGKAFLLTNEYLPAPVSYYDEYQDIGCKRQAELLDQKHLVYADIFKVDSKRKCIRLYTHHVVCDGKGGQIIVNDFIKELNARIQDKKIDYIKNSSPVKKYLPYLKGGPDPDFVTKLFIKYFNSAIATKRPEFSYDLMLDLQKKAFLTEGFVINTIEFSEDQTSTIIKNAKDKGVSVTAHLLNKIAATYDFDNVEVSVSIDGRKYYDIPADSGLSDINENTNNFATGGKIIIDKKKFADEKSSLKSITSQLKKITEPKNATKMVRTFSRINFAPVDIMDKKYAQIPMTEEEKKIDKSIGAVMGFTKIENGFDFASFGRIEFTPSDAKYSIESYRLVQNTASIYPLKFGIATYKGKMSIILTYKPSILDKKSAKKIVEKIKTSVFE
ncbi:MAG: hypothetical protein MJ185_00575 [Treponema sp.]|nr:hypothetical protein [Treponema sp.]